MHSVQRGAKVINSCFFRIAIGGLSRQEGTTCRHQDWSLRPLYRRFAQQRLAFRTGTIRVTLKRNVIRTVLSVICKWPCTQGTTLESERKSSRKYRELPLPAIPDAFQNCTLRRTKLRSCWIGSTARLSMTRSRPQDCGCKLESHA